VFRITRDLYIPIAVIKGVLSHFDVKHRALEAATARVIIGTKLTLLPGGSVLLNKLLPGSRLRVDELQGGLKRLAQVVTRRLDKELVLEVLGRDSGRQRGLVLLVVDLNEHSLLAGSLGENVHDLLGSVVLGSGQNLLVLQLIGVLQGDLHEKT
jgi:hypothetical protein